MDNVAPLCKDCHDAYGGNPSKRKEMRQRRNFWFEHCEKQSVILEKLEKTVQIFEDTTASGYIKLNRIESIVMELSDQNRQIMSQMVCFSPEQKLKAIDDIATTSSTIVAISGVALNLSLEDRMSISDRLKFKLNKTCPKCGKQFSIVPEPDVVPVCPKCGRPVTT